MQRLVLVKKVENIQLGHLYEHIICAHIDSLYFQNHLFASVDYSLAGTTYYGGVVVIDLEAYSGAAISLTMQIDSIDIVFSKDSISIAANQLIAEKEAPYGGSGWDSLIEALIKLHKQPWQKIDNLGIINTRQIRRKKYPIFLKQSLSLPARKLKISIVLDYEFGKNNIILLPFFRQIAWLLVANIQHKLADTYGYYSLSDKFTNNRQKICLSNVFNVANDQEVNIIDNLETCLELSRELANYDAFSRFTKELQNISYLHKPDLAPNIHNNYKDTIMLVGSKGWQEIATAENCQKILNNTSIELKFGKHREIQKMN